MKKKICLLLTLFFALGCFAALAESHTLICLGCTVNKSERVDFEGTATYTAVANESAVIGWKLNGVIQPNETSISFVFTVSGNTVVEAIYGAEDAPVQKTNKAQSGEPLVVRAVGCELFFYNKYNVAEGVGYTEIDFTDTYLNPVTNKYVRGGTVSFKVKAYEGKKPEYWVINGARYDFPQGTINFINIKNLSRSMTFEAVYKGQTSVTLLSDAQIQEKRTGEKLEVGVKHARMQLIKNSQTAISDDLPSPFDFTNDYRAPKTGATLMGGKCDLVVKANYNSSNEKVITWKFDDAVFKFSHHVERFYVHGLNESIVYTAIPAGIYDDDGDYWDDWDDSDWDDDWGDDDWDDWDYED